jgi:hypothetical protein
MRILSLVIIVFLLAAFSVGIANKDVEINKIDASFNNASNKITKINLSDNKIEETDIPNIEGFYLILEKYIHFIGVLGLEVTRAGVHFGHNNPDYFEAEYILKIAKWIIYLVIISLLIKPLMYFLIFIILCGMWLYDKFIKKKK